MMSHLRSHGEMANGGSVYKSMKTEGMITNLWKFYLKIYIFSLFDFMFHSPTTVVVLLSI